MSKRFNLPPRYTIGTESFEADSDDSSSRTTSCRTYHCHYCSSTKNFHDGNSLDEVFFECEICSKKFRQKSTYTRHKKIHNSEEKVFFCLMCKHTCESELSMQIHVTEAHVPKEDFYLRTEKTCKNIVSKDLRNQYTCEMCLKSFRRKYELNNHVSCYGAKLKSEKRLGSSKKQTPYRNIALQQSSQKEERGKEKDDVQSYSIGQVNFWPRVVLSSELNFILSRRMEEMKNEEGI